MSPALNGSSEIQCFERAAAIEIRDGIMLVLYPGLPHIQCITSVSSLIRVRTTCKASSLRTLEIMLENSSTHYEVEGRGQGREGGGRRQRQGKGEGKGTEEGKGRGAWERGRGKKRGQGRDGTGEWEGREGREGRKESQILCIAYNPHVS